MGLFLVYVICVLLLNYVFPPYITSDYISKEPYEKPLINYTIIKVQSQRSNQTWPTKWEVHISNPPSVSATTTAFSDCYHSDVVGGVTDTLGKTVGGVTDTAGNAVSGLGDTVSGATKGATDTVGSTAKGVGDTASNTTQGVGNTAKDATGGERETSAQNPLGLSS